MLLDDIAYPPWDAIVEEGKRDADPITIFRSELLFQCIHSRQETLGRETFCQFTGAVIIAGERSTGEFRQTDDLNLNIHRRYLNGDDLAPSFDAGEYPQIHPHSSRFSRTICDSSIPCTVRLPPPEPGYVV